jgi:hypothetical protein
VNRFVSQAYLVRTGKEARKRGTVTRIRPETTMTAEENRPVDTERQPEARRTVRFTAPDEISPEPATAGLRDAHVPVPQRAVLKDRLLRVAERVVGDWAPTLLEAMLSVLLFVGVLVVLGIALGAWVAVLGAVVGLAMFLVGRRRTGSGG